MALEERKRYEKEGRRIDWGGSFLRTPFSWRTPSSAEQPGPPLVLSYSHFKKNRDRTFLDDDDILTRKSNHPMNLGGLEGKTRSMAGRGQDDLSH